MDSITELLDASTLDKDKPLVAVLQAGTTLGSRAQKMNQMYSLINPIIDSATKVQSWVADSSHLHIYGSYSSGFSNR